MKHKKLIISLTAVLSAVLFLAVFLTVWFFGDFYKDFEKFEQSIEIPGLAEGAVPQGMGTYPASYELKDKDGNPIKGDDGKVKTATQNYFLISAYMTDGSPSRVYVTGETTGYVGYVTLKNADGTDFYGHCGGVATNGATLWVTGESKVNVAKTSDSKKYSNILNEIIKKAESTETDENGQPLTSIAFTTSFNANCRASFCYYYNDPRYSTLSYDRLYVGEFYRPGNYPTDDNHKITTPAGYKNTAFMYEYNVNTSSEYGLTVLNDESLPEESKVPKIQKIFSLPEKIQGVAWSGRTGYGTNDGIMVLSQSYGLANSHLLCFDYSKVTSTSSRKLYSALTGENFIYDGIKRPSGNNYTDSTLYVYFADKNDSNMFVKDYSIPSMSEGMCSVTPTTANNAPTKRIHVLFESGCKKYKLFVRKQTKNVYSFIPRS